MFNSYKKSKFQNTYSLNDRITESNRVITKYPDRIPIICEKAVNASKDCPDIDKNKYLSNKDLTIHQFIYVIRKRINIQSNKSIFVFVNGKIPGSTKTIGEIYDEHKHDDGFLYITYSFENVFG